MLSKNYPNFVAFMEEARQGSDGRLVINDSERIVYKMTFLVFNNKLGDLNFELINVNGAVKFQIRTIQNNHVKATTESPIINSDLTIEEWNESFQELMENHNSNPNHANILMQFTEQKLSGRSQQSSGCFSVLVVFLIITSVIFMSI